MARYILTRRSIPRIVSYVIFLVSLEWIMFLLFMYVDENAFIQKSELNDLHNSNENHKISYKTKTENRTVTLQPRGEQEQPRGKQVQPRGKQEKSRDKQEQRRGKQEKSRDKQEQPRGKQEKQELPRGKQEKSRDKQEQPGGKQEQPRGKQEQPGGKQEQPRGKQEQPRVQQEQPRGKQSNVFNEPIIANVRLDNIRNCSEKEVQLSNTSLPVTGLVGFPGSGNTWVRHLIQQMTGIGTRSMYCDAALRTKGFPFECIKEIHRTIVVKSHEEKHFIYFKKIVLLIRNPYDALLAYFAWAKAGHTGHPSKTALQKACNQTFDWAVWWYVDLINATLTRFKGPVHVLHYEKLKTDTKNELNKLAKFLKVNVTPHDIACTIELQEGNFHRKVNDAERLELLHAIYDMDKLLRLKKATKTAEKLFKDNLNLDIDVGNTVEKILLDKT